MNALAPVALTRAHELSGLHGTFAAENRLSPDNVAPAVACLLSDLCLPITGQVDALMGGRLGLRAHPKLFGWLDERDDWTARDMPR